MVPSSRTVTVLTRQHERFYKPLIFNRFNKNLAVQPSNRGTATAILFALFRLIKLGQQGTVAIFPSDHYVSDDLKFMSHVEAAATAVAIRPARIVLLGIPADRPETQYGWIEPDSFVLVSWITTLVDLFGRALPLLYVSFAQLLSALGTAAEREAIDRLYSSIGSESFSDRILVQFAQELSVLPVRGVTWSDLGDPMRVLATIDHLGIRPRWLAASRNRGAGNRWCDAK